MIHEIEKIYEDEDTGLRNTLLQLVTHPTCYNPVRAMRMSGATDEELVAETYDLLRHRMTPDQRT